MGELPSREDEATCTGYGFHPGTDGFATCLQRKPRAVSRYSACVTAVLGLGLLGIVVGGGVLALARSPIRSSPAPECGRRALPGLRPALPGSWLRAAPAPLTSSCGRVAALSFYAARGRTMVAQGRFTRGEPNAVSKLHGRKCGSAALLWRMRGAVALALSSLRL